VPIGANFYKGLEAFKHLSPTHRKIGSFAASCQKDDRLNVITYEDMNEHEYVYVYSTNIGSITQAESVLRKAGL